MDGLMCDAHDVRCARRSSRFFCESNWMEFRAFDTARAESSTFHLAAEVKVAEADRTNAARIHRPVRRSTRCGSTVLCDTTKGLRGQWLIVLCRDLCFGCLNICGIVDIATACRVVPRMLDTNQIGPHFCARQRSRRLGETENRSAEGGGGKSKTNKNLRQD